MKVRHGCCGNNNIDKHRWLRLQPLNNNIASMVTGSAEKKEVAAGEENQVPCGNDNRRRASNDDDT